MKESIIIAIFVIFIYMFFSLNKKSLVLMEASNSGYKFLVHNDKFKKESANTLSEIIILKASAAITGCTYLQKEVSFSD